MQAQHPGEIATAQALCPACFATHLLSGITCLPSGPPSTTSAGTVPLGFIDRYSGLRLWPLNRSVYFELYLTSFSAKACEHNVMQCHLTQPLGLESVDTQVLYHLDRLHDCLDYLQLAVPTTPCCPMLAQDLVEIWSHAVMVTGPLFKGYIPRPL